MQVSRSSYLVFLATLFLGLCCAFFCEACGQPTGQGQQEATSQGDAGQSKDRTTVDAQGERTQEATAEKTPSIERPATDNIPDKTSIEKRIESTPEVKTETPPADRDTTQRGWQKMKAPPLGARQENNVLALGGRIYILAGFDGNRSVIKTMEVYDPATDKWSRAADLPEAMHHVNAAVVGNKIYILGFLKTFRFAQDGRCFVYDASTDKWSKLKDMPVGQERGASGIGVIGDTVYLAGGFRGFQAVQTVSAYNTKTGTWTTLPSLPDRLDHMAAGVLKGTLYIAGGRDRDIGKHQDKLFALKPGQATWKMLAPMPTSRGGTAAAVAAGKFYVFGGEGNPKRRTGVFSETEVYDPSTNTWTKLADMPVPRHGTGAATIGGRIYVPVGADSQAFGATKVSEVYIP